MGDVKYPKKLTYVPHPFSCAASFIGGINNFRSETPQRLLLEMLIQWPSTNTKEEHLYQSVMASRTEILFWMESTSAGVLGPGGALAKLIKEESLGEVFETPEVRNPGHGSDYRNRGFMWVMDRPALSKWLTSNLTEELKKKIEQERTEYEAYLKKSRFY